MQETRVPSLIGEDATCFIATKPVHRKYSACALEAWSHNKRSHHIEKQLQSSPRSLPPKKSLQSKEDPAEPKGGKKKKYTEFDIGFNVEFVLEKNGKHVSSTYCVSNTAAVFPYIFWLTSKMFSEIKVTTAVFIVWLFNNTELAKKFVQVFP